MKLPPEKIQITNSWLDKVVLLSNQICLFEHTSPWHFLLREKYSRIPWIEIHNWYYHLCLLSMIIKITKMINYLQLSTRITQNHVWYRYIPLQQNNKQWIPRQFHPRLHKILLYSWVLIQGPLTRNTWDRLWAYWTLLALSCEMQTWI